MKGPWSRFERCITQSLTMFHVRYLQKLIEQAKSQDQDLQNNHQHPQHQQTSPERKRSAEVAFGPNPELDARRSGKKNSVWLKLYLLNRSSELSPSPRRTAPLSTHRSGAMCLGQPIHTAIKNSQWPVQRQKWLGYVFSSGKLDAILTSPHQFGLLRRHCGL